MSSLTADNAAIRWLRRSPGMSALLYVAVIGSLVAVTVVASLDMLERRAQLKETSFLLAQLQARGTGAAGALLTAQRPGSPFLEGPTVTVAGAALLQRVASAVQGAAGTIQSSSVDVSGNQARPGFVSLLVSCELEQASLQKVLYDLEAGMPFLFVDQLDVQAPQMTAMSPDGSRRVRVVLGVSGQWQRSP